MHRIVLVGLALGLLIGGQSPTRYLSFPEGQPLIAGFAAVGEKTPAFVDAPQWDQWIRARDAEIRSRVDRGVEDSIGNLIAYGMSFTTLPRIAAVEEAVTQAGDLTPNARARTHSLISALDHSDNERLRFVRDFLLRRRTRKSEVEAVLAANLRRFALEQADYQHTLKAAGESGDQGRALFLRSTLFENRGLSVDTSLLPNFAIEDTLRVMKSKGAAPGRIRRIAVIGPGLDFTDKRDGYDFYPLQTIQPFAILEAVLRLGLAQPGDIETVAFDLNPAVIAHVNRVSKQARAVLQLPRDPEAGWNAESIAYWNRFGEMIGTPVPPLPAPLGLRGLQLRAVAIKPQYLTHLGADDLNVVTQSLDPAPGQGFDLVIATNILVYYSRFEQALAMANIANMMNPGGIFLANTILPAQRPETLEFLGRRNVSYATDGSYGDDIVAYRKR